MGVGRRGSLQTLWSIPFSLVDVTIARCLKALEMCLLGRFGSVLFLAVFSVPYSTTSIKIVNEAFDNLLQNSLFTKQSL